MAGPAGQRSGHSSRGFQFGGAGPGRSTCGKLLSSLGSLAPQASVPCPVGSLGLSSHSLVASHRFSWVLTTRLRNHDGEVHSPKVQEGNLGLKVLVPQAQKFAALFSSPPTP